VEDAVCVSPTPLGRTTDERTLPTNTEINDLALTPAVAPTVEELTQSPSAIRECRADSMHVLYLYSGDHRRPDGLPHFLKKLGCMTTSMDLKNGHDLLDDAAWLRIRAGIRNIFDFVIMSPLCGSFSPARGQGAGPRALRSQDELFGLKNPQPPFTVSEKATIKDGNYHVNQVIDAGTLCAEVGVGFAIECPAIIFKSQVSMLQFPSAKKLDTIPGVINLVTDQCPFGAESRKPTNFKVKVNRKEELWRTTLAAQCDHVSQNWDWQDPKGNSWKSWSPHPPLIGRKREDGSWATSKAENYPTKLNATLAFLISKSGKALRHGGSSMDTSTATS
jgi:hypothetical protein